MQVSGHPPSRCADRERGYLHDTQTETLVVDCVLDCSCHRYCLDVALGLGGVVTRSAQANAWRWRHRGLHCFCQSRFGWNGLASTERHGIGWSLTFPLCLQPTFSLPGRSVPSLCRRSRELSRLSSYGFRLRVMARTTFRLLFQDRFQLQS